MTFHEVGFNHTRIYIYTSLPTQPAVFTQVESFLSLSGFSKFSIKVAELLYPEEKCSVYPSQESRELSTPGGFAGDPTTAKVENKSRSMMGFCYSIKCFLKGHDP